MIGTDVIADACRIIGTNADGEPPEPWQAIQHMQRLNELMAEWLAQGYELGFQPLVSPTDTVYVPDWAKRAVKYNLAVAIAPEYGRPVSPDLLRLAEESKNVVAKITATTVLLDESDLPQGRRNSYFNVVLGT